MLSLSSRNHVPITYREIESHEYNVAAQILPQSRTFPEKFGLSGGYFAIGAAMNSARCRDAGLRATHAPPNEAGEGDAARLLSLDFVFWCCVWQSKCSSPHRTILTLKPKTKSWQHGKHRDESVRPGAGSTAAARARTSSARCGGARRERFAAVPAARAAR